jgi:hypothetical protein
LRNSRSFGLQGHIQNTREMAKTRAKQSLSDAPEPLKTCSPARSAGHILCFSVDAGTFGLRRVSHV